MRPPFSAHERHKHLAQLDGSRYDLVVIGGGITGAGIFRDATLRGLKALLVERDDFASGTSSKSSKLVHGGLRYLQSMHIALTRESCRERELLMRLNPYLVRPMPFLLPIYRGAKLHPLFIRMGLRFYEYLAGGVAIHFRMLKPDEAKKLAPLLRTERLRRAALYYDSTVDDARLTIDNICAGVAHGGLACNHLMCSGFDVSDGKLAAVRLQERDGRRSYVVQAPLVVNATGIDCDVVRGFAEPMGASMLRASKGVHLVVSRELLPLDTTVAFTNPPDGRLMFAIPWLDKVLIGTTDTFEPGDVRTTSAADVSYILDAARSVFELPALAPAQVLAAIAGVRTLIVDPRSQVASASAVSREHQLYDDPCGLISIAGGKLTTYRTMAIEVLERLVARLPEERRRQLKPCATDHEPLVPPVDLDSKRKELKSLYGVGDATAEHLVRTYGSRAHEPLAQASHDKRLLRPLCAGGPFLRCEVPYVCRYEAPLHLDDLLTRRLRAALWAEGQARAEADSIAALMGESLGWDGARQAEEAARYRALVLREFRPS